MAVANPLSDTKTVLSIQDFKKLLQTSTPDEIAQIPIVCLPRVIPDEVINSVSDDKRKVLENIIFELNMREVNERLQIESRYTADVSNALFYYSDYFGKENFNVLKRKLSELGGLYKEWKEHKQEQKRLAMLPKIKELNLLVDALRMETKSIVDAKAILEEGLNAAVKEDQAHFVAEIENLVYMVGRNEEKMSQYYYLRLLIIGADMRYLSIKIKDSSDEVAIIQDKINQNHARLTKLSGGSILPVLSKKANQDFAEKLRAETNELIELKKSLEVPISETSLIAWLDVVVDATLTDDKRPGSDSLLNKVRMILFHLLQQYCQQQENAALDVAKNPFTQAAPEDVIKFLLKSEEFILDYFKKKRLETAKWMGDLAESKVNMLDDIEKSLLKELKKNNKLVKKVKNKKR